MARLSPRQADSEGKIRVDLATSVPDWSWQLWLAKIAVL
jgi:hypothetical protein